MIRDGVAVSNRIRAIWPYFCQDDREAMFLFVHPRLHRTTLPLAKRLGEQNIECECATPASLKSDLKLNSIEWEA